MNEQGEDVVYPVSIDELVPSDWVERPFVDGPWPELDDGTMSAVVNWRTMDDIAATRVWTELGNWVDWLCNRYSLSNRKVPDCWYRHGALVEELSALHSAWVVAFDEAEAGNGPLGWQERFHLALQRISDIHYAGECSRSEGHQAPPKRSPARDSDAWKKWIHQSHGKE